nr:hypothetical protein Iba_chr05eCG10790 [Ipomoea batatas]
MLAKRSPANFDCSARGNDRCKARKPWFDCLSWYWPHYPFDQNISKDHSWHVSKADREAALIQWRLWLPTLERLFRPEESSGRFCCFLRPGSVPAINRFVEGQGGIHLECPEIDHLLQAGNASRSENARWRKKQRPDLQPLTLNLNLDKVRGVDGDGGVELEEDRDVGTGGSYEDLHVCQTEHFMELFHRVALNRGGGNSLHKRLRLYLRKHQSIYSQTLLLAYE